MRIVLEASTTARALLRLFNCETADAHLRVIASEAKQSSRAPAGALNRVRRLPRPLRILFGAPAGARRIAASSP